MAQEETKKETTKTEEAAGISPVLFGLAFLGVLLAAVVAMLLLTAADTKETPAPATLDSIAAQGKALFIGTGNCNTCHPAEGRKAGIGPRLSTIGLSEDNIRSYIRKGKGSMPANTIISDDDITKILVYLRAIKASSGT
jgi:mono/diheme cytochrome c family protein